MKVFPRSAICDNFLTECGYKIVVYDWGHPTIPVEIEDNSSLVHESWAPERAILMLDEVKNGWINLFGNSSTGAQFCSCVEMLGFGRTSYKSEEERRLQVPRACLETATQDLNEHVQFCIVEGICTLDDVCISGREGRKTRKVVVPGAT
jgi:hypothetical protein